MYWFYVCALTLIGFVVLILLWYYPNEQTTLFVKLVVGLAWFDNLSVLVLVPNDVKNTLYQDGAQTDAASVELLATLWSSMYWISISFTVLILPFVQKYSDSGEFFIQDRSLSAIIRNGSLWITLIIAAVSGFGILAIMGEKITFMEFITWCLAVINAYGQICAILLLGYGMVDIPRKLWQKASFKNRQNFLFQAAGMQIEKTAEAHLELSKEYNSVVRFDGQFSQGDKMRPFMDVIVNMLSRVEGFTPEETEEDEQDINLDTETRHGLAILRRRLRKAIEGYFREREEYLSIVHDYLYLHDTIKNLDRSGMSFVYTNGRKAPVCFGCWIWWWRCRIKPLFHRTLAILTASLSIGIVLAEVSISEYLPNLSGFSQLLHAVKSSDVALLSVSFIILFYILTCTYYTLVRLGRFSFYRLVPKHTAPFSLASNALLIVRFTFPLVFNIFVSVLLPLKKNEKIDVKNTEFWGMIGERISDMPLLGKYFTTYIPILMLPYVILIACNGVNRVMSVLDPKLKYSFKDNWVLDLNSNYAYEGRQAMHQEIENHQKGIEAGLAITDALRRAKIAEVPAIKISSNSANSGRTKPSTWRRNSFTRVPRLSPRMEPGRSTPNTQYSESPFSARARMDPSSTSVQTPLLPNEITPRRSAPDMYESLEGSSSSQGRPNRPRKYF